MSKAGTKSQAGGRLEFDGNSLCYRLVVVQAEEGAAQGRDGVPRGAAAGMMSDGNLETQLWRLATYLAVDRVQGNSDGRVFPCERVAGRGR